MNLWFGSRSSRHRRSPSNVLPGPSDTSLVSQSTVGPPQTPGNLNSTSDVPLDEVDARTNDPSVYAPAPSLIHSTEKETLRTSDVPAGVDATTFQRDTQRVSVSERPGGILFTPQDAIVAQVFGRSAQPVTNPPHATPPSPSNAPQTSVSMTSDSAPTPLSVVHASRRELPALTVYDPFSGAMLGERTPMSPSTATQGEPSTFAPLPTADDRKLWSSLERILELQAEIAAMHADMEGVGKPQGNNTHTGGVTSVGTSEGGKARPRKGLARAQTLPIGDEEPEEHEPEGGAAAGAISEISTEHSDGEDEEDEEEEDGVHGYGKKKRDEEFAKLAEQFTQRKAAIGGIMNKLDALSTALKTFHTIPPPLFDLATSPSRADTVSLSPSTVTAASPPPFQSHPGRPSSSRSPVSPFRVGNPVTLPRATPSPPVPPVSTLAPPVSSRHSIAGFTPVVVAPVLPQVALPTIIPGAPHVESPADMHHASPIFPGVS